MHKHVLRGVCRRARTHGARLKMPALAFAAAPVAIVQPRRVRLAHRPRRARSRIPRRARVACVRAGHDPPEVRVVFADPAEGEAWGRGTPLPRQALVYIAGLDAAPLPATQLGLDAFVVLSVCHRPADRSGWEALERAVVDVLASLAGRSRRGVVLVGESFGAALAIRACATCGEGVVERLVLVNSGTALVRSGLVGAAATLLPLLKVDRTERVLYKAAAVVMYRGLLVDEARLHPENVPVSERQWLRSVDIDAVPLDAMLHRVRLLRMFSDTFSDRCVRDLVTVPTVLVASGRDRLLPSVAEVKRLKRLLPNVESSITLPKSGHAALLEEDVQLCAIFNSTAVEKASVKTRETPDEFAKAYDIGSKLFAPWRAAVSPSVAGEVNVRAAVQAARGPDGLLSRPILFAGNHSVFGLLDLSLLYIELNELLNGTRLRSLAHSTHFEQFGELSGGRWSQFVSDLGGVPASPRQFYRLLRDNEAILLFPGGAREVCKRKGEKYELFWKSETDFVRSAARFNALIVPFSAVGADDCVDILFDGREMQAAPVVGPMLTQALEQNGLSPEFVMPLGTFPPKPDRFYFKFHKPIDTANTSPRDLDACRVVYGQTKRAVEVGIQELLYKRKMDPDRDIVPRLARKFSSSTRHASNRFERLPRLGDSVSVTSALSRLFTTDFDI